MPALTFVLPHWLYWAGLVVFPPVAMYLVARQKSKGAPEGASLFIAYLFWLLSGFIGIHRFYLKSALGFVFVAVFGAILYCNAQIRDLREDVSRTRAAAESVHVDLQRAREQATRSPGAAAAERVQKAEAAAKAKEADFAVAEAHIDRWRASARWAAILMAALLLVDAALIPGVVRRLRAREPAVPTAAAIIPEVTEGGTGEDPAMGLHTRLTDALEWLNVRAGEYVAWWAVIAVVVYYYEVVARFVFNSPTNWVHESMFLMFGMQYMLSGAYAYREDQHVRVDILYAKLSARGKAIADIVTSVFFFIFAGTMLWTGTRFAMDAIQVGEHSFTEWGIQYWPVKLAIPVGAALILLQGISKLIKDIVLLARPDSRAG